MAFHVINVYNYSLRFKMFRCSSSIPSSERSSVTSGSRPEQGPYVTDGEGKWTKKKKGGGRRKPASSALYFTQDKTQNNAPQAIILLVK